ncbi:hypothetical protein AB0467_28380 [Streptomyces sp. NPDC052095]|uniref:hypothetical protein n=1 Tax=unclassified Streptomyces TaxID=2593676 RepID=UPI00344C3AD4
MTPAAQARLGRVRSSAGIAKLAVQQLEEELGGPVDAEPRAGLLRELLDEAFPQDDLFGSPNQPLTTASRVAALTPLYGEDPEPAARVIGETAACIGDPAGPRLHLATSTLHPQGERA